MENIIWKPILGYEDLYEVSNKGDVRSLPKIRNSKSGSKALHKGRVIKKYVRNEYYSVMLYKDNKPKNHTIHRLVAVAFIPNPEGKKTVNHKDANKSNNRVENLEWATWSENNLHAHVVGLHNQKGSNNNSAKLNERDIEEIFEFRHKGFLYKEIAEIYNVTPSTIGNIIRKKTWKHIQEV